MENNEMIESDATPTIAEPEIVASPMEGNIAPGLNIVPHGKTDGGESFQVVPHGR